MKTQPARDLFSRFAIAPRVRMCVTIPVRDEAESIEKTLRAFARQRDASGKPFDFETFEILVLANNCTDDSVKIIENFQRRHPQINLYAEEIALGASEANIGFVRRALMNAACVRMKQNAGVLLTTDGDTVAADDWLAANLREIELGADAVGGRILIDAGELEKMDAHSRETHLKDEEYRLLTAEIESLIDELPFDGAPRHHQHFNASFAVKSEIYEKAGGIPDVRFLEDCAFFDRLQRIDARVRHSPHVKVYTSSRHVGRCEVGLSFQLNMWKDLNESGEDFLVESAESIVARFTIKKDLRKIWCEFSDGSSFNSEEINSAAERIFVSPETITSELEKRQTFGAFYGGILHEQNDNQTQNFPPVTLEKALQDLKKLTIATGAQAARLHKRESV